LGKHLRETTSVRDDAVAVSSVPEFLSNAEP